MLSSFIRGVESVLNRSMTDGDWALITIVSVLFLLLSLLMSVAVYKYLFLD